MFTVNPYKITIVFIASTRIQSNRFRTFTCAPYTILNNVFVRCSCAKEHVNFDAALCYVT